MSVGVALYLSGEGRKQIEGAWKRVLAAGFPSPARVPGQRPHVSLVNGEGELPLAHHLGSELAVPLARVDPFACELQALAVLLGNRRVAYYPLVESTVLRKIHETVTTWPWPPECKSARRMRQGLGYPISASLAMLLSIVKKNSVPLSTWKTLRRRCFSLRQG